MNKKTTIILIVVGILVAGLLYVLTIGSKDKLVVRSEYQQSRITNNINLALTQLKENNLSGAKESLLNNLSLVDYDEETCYWLVQVLLAMDEREKAYVYINQLLSKSTNSELLINMGSVFAMQGLEKTALTFYAKAQKEDPLNPDVYIELGKFYGNQEKFAKAIGVWQDGLSIAPSDKRFEGLLKAAFTLLEEEKSGASNQN